VFVAVAFLVALHQYLYWGSWFDFGQIHHESFIIALVFAALVTYVQGRLHR
jgi:hypothetical protein